jgi:hypothetical protein
VPASGPLGIYGIVEKVVLEPDEKSRERIQVWGAFMYVDGPGTAPGAVSPARRGYLYFSLPPVIPGFTSSKQIDLVRNEWADLKAVADRRRHPAALAQAISIAWRPYRRRAHAVGIFAGLAIAGIAAPIATTTTLMALYLIGASSLEGVPW